MSSYRNRNQNRQRSRDSLDRKMEKWIQTGKQVVDGVAGNRPGQRRVGWQDKATGQNLEKVGRWMEEKIDWFFEDDDEWLDNEDSDSDSDSGSDYDSFQEKIIHTKRPLGAISLRAPKALPAQLEEKRNNLNEYDEWPDDEAFKISKWERKRNLIKQNEKDMNGYFQDEQSNRRRNIPRSSRRRY